MDNACTMTFTCVTVIHPPRCATAPRTTAAILWFSVIHRCWFPGWLRLPVCHTTGHRCLAPAPPPPRTLLHRLDRRFWGGFAFEDLPLIPLLPPVWFPLLPLSAGFYLLHAYLVRFPVTLLEHAAQRSPSALVSRIRTYTTASTYLRSTVDFPLHFLLDTRAVATPPTPAHTATPHATTLRTPGPTTRAYTTTLHRWPWFAHRHARRFAADEHVWINDTAAHCVNGCAAHLRGWILRSRVGSGHHTPYPPLTLPVDLPARPPHTHRHTHLRLLPSAHTCCVHATDVGSTPFLLHRYARSHTTPAASPLRLPLNVGG